MVTYEDDDNWFEINIGSIQITQHPSGLWGSLPYLHFYDTATGKDGEVWGRAVQVLCEYMSGPRWLLIEPRLKECSTYMGGDVSYLILEKFKEDEQDRIDMQVMQIVKQFDDHPNEENVQEVKPKVQSQVWQKQSGLRSTAPNFSAITSFTTRDSKPKLNGG